MVPGIVPGGYGYSEIDFANYSERNFPKIERAFKIFVLTN
jgi:hypothetical protein